MAKLRDIVFDAQNPAALARFWAAILDGYDIRPYDAAEIERLATLGFTPETDPSVMVDGDGPSLCFQKMPEPKGGRNRIHLDLTSSKRGHEVQRLCALGARIRDVCEDYTILLDLEDNAFCVLDPRPNSN